MCGLDDVDDDLGGEVAEEANKFGVVERCFVYLVPGSTQDDECVRIFLVMSGCVLSLSPLPGSRELTFVRGSQARGRLERRETV